MEKEFKTIDEQIELLQSRNLHIENENIARKILLNNNYYYLINGYKDLFLNKNSKEEKFVNGATLEEIYSLYEFDRKIRIIFLEYILLVERKIDTYIAYEFSKNYGHKNYLIPENFNNSNKNRELILKFINDINLEISHQYKNSNKMIIHYLDTYKYIPLWVLIRILSFGKVSKFYSFMKQKEQNNISRKFNIQSETLKIYLINLGNVRNICAHDEKLYDVRLKKRINITDYHRQLMLTRKDNKSGFRGVYQIKNGKYRVSIGFRGERIYLGIYEIFDDAVEARLSTEKELYGEFLERYHEWEKKSVEDPSWRKGHPFSALTDEKMELNWKTLKSDGET